MRGGFAWSLAVLAVLYAGVPAFAQSAPAAAKPAPGNPASGKSPYESAPLAQRIALQSDLVWTGHLNSIADGAWGPRSTAAVKAYQKARGSPETGTLTMEERAALAADARAKQAKVGWRMVEDADGTRLGIPGKLVPQGGKGRTTGGHWQSADGNIRIDTFRQPAPATLAVVHGLERKNPGRRITYDVLRPDFFVLAGTEGPRKFYMRAQAGRNDVRGVIVRYEPALEATMAPIVVAISGAFVPQPPANDGAPGRRAVEYSTGVVVSASGAIVAEREATDGCQTIVAGRLGNAERIADDSASGLALLRVYGARDLRPLPLGDAARHEVTLVGIPDPQTQGGNGEVAMTTARLLPAGERTTLEAIIAQGMAGAAAIDSETGFAGILVRGPQLVAGPSTGAASFLAAPEAIRKLLTARQIAFSAGRAGADSAKDSVLRLICVRK